MTSEFASTQTVALYVNATTREIQRDGITKSIRDDYWTAEIVPILYPVWDSDRDKLESFIHFKDGSSKMLKNKYQRNQRTGEYNWVSYEFNLSAFPDNEVVGLYTALNEKFTNYRDIEDYDLDRKLQSTFAKDSIVNWTKLKIIRKFLLMDSDWTQMSDNNLTTEQKAQWVTYRQKLRDLPSDHSGVPAVEVPLPITPSKYEERVAQGDEDGYLDNTKQHFYHLNQTVYKKYTERILAYLAISISVKSIDDMPVSAVYDSDTETNLDAILEAIANGEV